MICRFPSFGFSVLLVVLIGFCSCGASKNAGINYVYFNTGADTITTVYKETLIRPYDLLHVQVYSGTINQEQAAIFNLPASGEGATAGYQVSADGFIGMPVIGQVKAAGLTRTELQAFLTAKLSSFVKNPSVVVRFQEFTINILGEVKSPGIQRFAVDQVSIIDAISAAGDLTDFASREQITVVREEGGKKMHHKIDLRSRDIFQSPVYQLQQNDIVYVRPTKEKLKRMNVDPQAQRKTSVLLSVTTALISVANLVFLRVIK